jgi:hypothetical protein
MLVSCFEPELLRERGGEPKRGREEPGEGRRQGQGDGECQHSV